MVTDVKKMVIDDNKAVEVALSKLGLDFNRCNGELSELQTDLESKFDQFDARFDELKSISDLQ